MNKEYVVISKTDIDKRINELKNKQKDLERLPHNPITTYNDLQHEINNLNKILSQSTPLEPIIENSFDAGSAYCLGSHELFKQTHPNKQDYMKNLKLDI